MITFSAVTQNKCSTYLSLRKSTTCLKSAWQYSLLMSMRTLSEPDCTGTCRNEYTLGWFSIFAISYNKENYFTWRIRQLGWAKSNLCSLSFTMSLHLRPNTVGGEKYKDYYMYKNVTSKCSNMYGGLVIPTLSRAPSGITSTNCHRSSGNDTPMSLP